MLSAIEMMFIKNNSINIAVSPSRAIAYLITMIKVVFKLSNCQLSVCLVLFVILQFPNSVIAIDDQSEDAKLRRFLGPQTATDQTHNSIPTSSQQFSFHDVLQIEIISEIPGNIRIIAIDNNDKNNDTIAVTLEKRVIDKLDIFTDTFLKNISISGKNSDGILQLTPQIPNDYSKVKLEEQKTTDITKHLQLNYEIKTPPDISVRLKVKNGNVYIHRLRGKVAITNEMGNVHLDETLGNYEVEVNNGRVHGSILMIPGENHIKTDDGSIDLTILDELATPMELTANGGNIGLFLPENYPADIKFKNKDQHFFINLPSEMDNNIFAINGGGPLLQLASTGTISILPNPKLRSLPEESLNNSLQEDAADEYVLPIYHTPIQPSIDGNLSETAWLDATVLPAFQNPLGTETAKNPTDVFLMWDNRYFFIGVRAHIQEKQVPRLSQTQHDSPIWEDESIEILLDMTPESTTYSHLIINPIGGLFDQLVIKEGYPNFRFVPSDVKLEQVDDSVVRFRANSSWNSEAIVATKINANTWSLEVAIPRESKEKGDNETWLFNLHRKSQVKHLNEDELHPVVQREYSYWLPINDEKYPWWPHWKEGMGKIRLIEKQPPFTDSYQVSEKFIVEKVEIDGNSVIPTEDVLKEIPIVVGSTITNEQLSRVITELENSDLFQDVQLKTVVMDTKELNHQSVNRIEILQNPADIGVEENGISENQSNMDSLRVTVQISIKEAPVNYVNLVSISGNQSFPNKFIKDWYDIFPGYTSVATMHLKQLMINDFYLNRGFPFAKVTHEFANDVLQYKISEGNLDEIRFTGNRKISRTELISALDIDTQGVYFHSLGQAKVNNLHKKLSKTNDLFKSVSDWHVQSEGGRNVLIVDIKERSLIKPGLFPIVGYNRVHGVVLGAGGTLTTRYINTERLFGSVSLGVSSRIVNYHVGIENSLFERIPLTVGAGLFKLTDYSFGDLRLRPAEISLGDSFYGTSVDNYFQRQGQHFWIANKFGQSSQLRLEYTLDNHTNLFKSTNWSYLQMSLVKLGNPRIATGSLRMVSFRYTFDTRDHKSRLDSAENLASQMILKPNERTRRGWRGNFGVEISGNFLGGDLTYNVYNFELARYNPLIGLHNLNFRIVGDFADTALPRQRLLYLGGSKTLRGYSFNSFAGDRRILLNVEHRIANEFQIDTGTDAYIGWALSTFLDIGQIWEYDDNIFADFTFKEIKSSVGIGFSIFISPLGSQYPISNVFDFAIPITRDSTLRTPKLFWRLERMF